MSNEKRKVNKDWVDATLIEADGLRGSYIAQFSGVVPPSTTTFREYKRKRSKIDDDKDAILQGETERIEFEGRTKEDDNTITCQYLSFLYTAHSDMLSASWIEKQVPSNYCLPQCCKCAVQLKH